MAGRQIKWSVFVDAKQPSQALSSVGDDFRRADRDVEESARRFDKSAQGIADSSDMVASRGAQAAGGLAGVGEVIGGPFGSSLVAAGLGLQFAADSGDIFNAALDGMNKRILLIVAVSTLIVAALAALAFGLVYAYKHSETFRAAVDKVWAALKRAWQQIATALQPTLDRFSAWLATKGTVLINKLSVWITTKLVPAIDKTAKWIATKLIPWLQKVVPPIARIIGKIIEFQFKTQRSVARIVVAIARIVAAAVRMAAGVGRAVGSAARWVAALPGRIRRAASGMFDGVVSNARSAFNSIAGLWNGTVGAIGFSVPSWVPGMGGRSFSVPNVPMLASGGIATGPTLAMIGEGSESEAILPLSKLEALLGGGGGGGTYNINVSVPLGASPAEVGRAIVAAIEQYVRAGGKRPSFG